MSLTYQRPIALEDHPVVAQKYIVPTPSIDELYVRVKKLIRLRTPGAIIYAHPRFGKTYGVRYVSRMLKEDYPKLVVISFGCQKKKSHSEDAFFANLLDAAGHKDPMSGNITRKRFRLNERIKELVDNSGLNWVVFFADEAQRLDIIEYEWLRDVHDELERRGVRMITLLVGQPQLLNQKSSFRIGKQTQIVSRFMIDEMRFRGLCSANDLATCLAGFDHAFFPESSKWSYTRYFLPAAFGDGLRLMDQAAMLWRTFQEAHEEARFDYELEIPMQYFARSVEIALLESMDNDSYDFRFSPAIWHAAVAESNFISAQEELRLVMGDEFHVRGI
ncbi:Uncharacterized conserved protein [Janthinobacterium sp. Marseille]|nr:ATP-binding protein [Janthinobacterium sp. Marseille]ABR91923.1 Uncharacterized conserved protein [Janthinobacterium sp. Marseille]